ncbi:hypothetical protein [Paraburkholderia sp. 40]|uniref:hypothetical protein n=1 Tax=unclassified Paraburkholderia TaxID=2615204 RepID=UPI003D226940
MAKYALGLTSRRKESGEGQHESNEKSAAQNKKPPSNAAAVLNLELTRRIWSG